MATIEENLRATLLSLKQISDRVKSLILSVVTKSELNSAKQEVLDAIDNIPEPDLTTIAKEDTSQEILTAVENIDFSEIAKQGTNSSATLTTTQAALIDGNDTAISVSKEVRSEVGTSSDTAGETGTLFAILKWVKDKVKSIYNIIGTPTTGQPNTLFAAIAAGGGGGGGDATAANQQIIIDAVKDGNDTTIGVVKDIDTYGAKEAAATANKNQVISAIGDTLSMNMLATGLSAMAGVPMNVITDDSTTTAYTLNANELYYFNNRSSDLNLTLDLTTVTQGDAADFHFIVQVGNTAAPLTVTIKDSNNNDVVWSWDVAPDFVAGVIYEIGIINNLALYVSYAV